MLDIVFFRCFSQPEDSVNEMSSLSGSGRLVVIDTIWGHTGAERLLIEIGLIRVMLNMISGTAAGGGSNPVDDAFVQAQIKAFLEE